MERSLTDSGTSVRKPKRGRKSPKGLSIWEDRFSKKLRKHHKHFAKKVFHRLMK